MPQEIVNITCNCKIEKPIYTHNNKKYIDLELSQETVRRIESVHGSFTKFLDKENKIIPLTGTKLKVKVPFRYNKVTCKMPGKKTIHEGLKGDKVSVNLEFCGVWTVGEYCGVSWKVTMFNLGA
jgi:hypothetical protein